MAEPMGEQGERAEGQTGEGTGTPSPRPKPDKTHRHWGRRKRRLRRAALILAVVAVAGTIGGVALYRHSRPEAYTPGEETEGITQRLAQGLPEDAPEPRLTDVTGEAGLADFRSFAGTRTSQLPEDMGSGLAWGDYDSDGDEDLFVVAAGGALTADPETWAESVLYENLLADTGKATFRRSDAMEPLRIIGMGAAWGDYDGDGSLDLAVSGYRALRLFRNQGGRLVPDQRSETAFAPFQDGYWAGLSWGDYDLDRDLDLYVTGYVRYEEDPDARNQVSRQYGHAVPYTLNPVSYEPERNLLFRNEGDGRFVEVAEALGVANTAGRSLGALWRDFDDDGRLDLYVANDVSDNALFRNVADAGGSGAAGFEDIGLAAWVADYRGAMGLAAGDWNRDGDDDLFVTHWVAQENALYDNLLADIRARDAARPPEMAGPALPAGIGFSDMAAPLGLGQIALRFVGWGTELLDLDADGWLDLVVVNGSTFESKEDHAQDPAPEIRSSTEGVEAPSRQGARPSQTSRSVAGSATPPGRMQRHPNASGSSARGPHLEPQVPLLLWNRRGEHFHDLAPLNPELSKPHVGRGMAAADYDQDGDLDLAIMHYQEGVQLLRNDMQTGGWIELRLASRGPSGELTGLGEGATVIAHAGDTVLRRSVTGASYLSQSSRTVHFGLGDAGRLDTVEVHWLGGGTDTYRDLAAGTLWELREGDPTPRRIAGADAAGGAEQAAARETASDPTQLTERERLARFWQLQRSGMDAIKGEKDPVKAEGLFRQALQLEPDHEDAHYYLAAALTAQGRTDEALEHLHRLTEINPQSHRGFKRWGTLRALTATSPEHLEQAARALERSHELNKEETGSLLVLGEIDLLRGHHARARQHLEWATTTNARAVGGLFFLGYLDWKQGDEASARERLQAAREALGPDWVPEGAVAEGDTEETMHEEESPLGRFVRAWDGRPEPDGAYATLEAFLASR